MRSTLIVAAVTAVGFAEAASRGLVTTSLFRRQAFDPTESTGTGANCVEAFGSGYVECVPETETDARLCVNPDLGETCCDNKWGCPADSFCLVQDLCCPTGLDPATCASENGVTLPSDFGEPQTSAPVSAPSSVPSFVPSFVPSSSSSEEALFPSSAAAPLNPPSTTDSGSGATAAPTNSSARATTTGTAPGPVKTAGAAHERAGVAAALLGLAAAFAL